MEFSAAMHTMQNTLKGQKFKLRANGLPDMKNNQGGTIHTGPMNYWSDNGKIYIIGYWPIIKLQPISRADNAKPNCFQ